MKKTAPLINGEKQAFPEDCLEHLNYAHDLW